MDRKFKLLFLLLFVGALATPTQTAEPSETSPAPATEEPPKTSPAPATEEPPKTSPAPATEEPPKTSPAPATEEPPKTSPAPATEEPPKTSPAPATEEPPKTSPAPATEEPPKTSPAPATEEPPKTSPAPATEEPPKTSPAPATEEPPKTSTAPATEEPPKTSTAAATAEPPKTSTAAATAEPPKPTTERPDPCKSNTCGRGSTCEARAGATYVCLCLPGDTYNEDSKSCESAKVFPGKLNLATAYDSKMADKTSALFKTTADKIVAELTETFKAEGGVPTVVELWPFTPPKLSKVWSRSEPDSGKKTGATVEIVFKANSDIKTGKVDELMTKAIQSGDILAGATYDESNLCEENPCDLETSNCSSSDGKFNCTCKDGYIYSDFSNRMCLACPSGQKANGTENCVDCPFGYSGLNCNDSWELVLVIVGSVLGGLLLITIILLPILATKGSKKSSKKKKNKDTGNTYVNSSPVKSPLVNSSFAISNPTSVKGGSGNGLSSFANAGVPRIPRATSNNSWDNRTSLEMTPSNSRQNLMPVGRNQRLYEDPDDMNSSPYAQRRPQDNPYAQNRPQSNLYAQNRPQSNPYAQDRPQSNPYAQNRPQTNPYASSQGMTNSYYVHDDGRRFN